jgi:MoaA/NifB/PqqE/SkfB family radical SAM enzyme
VDLVASLPGDIRAWIITSGQGMDDTLASDLAEAGLQGVVLSLDHWDPDLHDAFRGRPGTFRGALAAAGMARAAGLDLALSLCPTRAFMAREENLWRYAALARDLGAGQILVVEPKAAGHFTGESVELDEAALARFERFYQEVEFGPRHRDLPVFTAPGLVGRRSQCLGNGDRFLYLDPAGEVHPCQFCRGSVGNACTEDLGVLATRLRSTGCPHESCEVRTEI